MNDSTKFSAIQHYAFEGLRFNPVFPILKRHCIRDTSIVLDSGEAIKVHGGASLSLFAIAAMHDPKIYPDPRRFQLDRPLSAHLHFGSGLKRCFGDKIAEIQITEMMTALLQQPKLERISRGYKGDLKYEGPYLRHFQVNIA